VAAALSLHKSYRLFISRSQIAFGGVTLGAISAIIVEFLELGFVLSVCVCLMAMDGLHACNLSLMQQPICIVCI